MAREPVVVAGLTAANGSGAATTVNVTPAFPDSFNRGLVIAVHNEDTTAIDNSISTITVGGVAAQLVKAQAGQVDVSIYAFPNPPKATFAVVVTPAQLSTCKTRVAVYEVEGLEPVLGGTTDGVQGTATTSTLTLTSPDLATSFCFEAISIFFGTTAPPSSSAAGGFTQDDTGTAATSPFRARYSSAWAQQPGGASVSPSFAWNGSSRARAHAAAEFRGEELFPSCATMGMGGF